MDERMHSIGKAIAHCIGETVIECAPLSQSGGYSPALRLRARLASGSSVFVKVATNTSTADWLQTEAAVYRYLGPQDFLPHFFGFVDETFPLLILEDLSAAHWPPPWRTGDVEKVLAAIAQFHSLAARFPPGFLKRQEEGRSNLASWHLVAEDPAAFLSLGLCSAAWLEAALPRLIAADTDAILDGDDLVHYDIRSDNLCFTQEGRLVLVDWNWACIGNGKMDIAGWLSSLHREGGPLPEELLPDEPELAALLAGFWAFRAGTPPPDFTGGERIRRVQRQQLSVALPWAARALGLPPLA